EVGRVHVGYEAKGEIAPGVGAKRLVRHHRAEVGAADADVDDVADRLAGPAPPLARADALGEGRHTVEHLVDGGHDVLAVDTDVGAARRPQGYVQDGAILGHVDLLAGEHRLDPL